MKKLLTLAGIAALLAGCYSIRNDYPPASGSSTADENVYTGSDQHGTLGPTMVQTNFTPVNSGVEAAMPPGSASGGALRQTR